MEEEEEVLNINSNNLHYKSRSNEPISTSIKRQFFKSKNESHRYNSKKEQDNKKTRDYSSHRKKTFFSFSFQGFSALCMNVYHFILLTLTKASSILLYNPKNLSSKQTSYLFLIFLSILLYLVFFLFLHQSNESNIYLSTYSANFFSVILKIVPIVLMKLFIHKTLPNTFYIRDIQSGLTFSLVGDVLLELDLTPNPPSGLKNIYEEYLYDYLEVGSNSSSILDFENDIGKNIQGVAQEGVTNLNKNFGADFIVDNHDSMKIQNHQNYLSLLNKLYNLGIETVDHKVLFILGLFSFLIAHILYSRAFYTSIGPLSLLNAASFQDSSLNSKLSMRFHENHNANDNDLRAHANTVESNESVSNNIRNNLSNILGEDYDENIDRGMNFGSFKDGNNTAKGTEGKRRNLPPSLSISIVTLGVYLLSLLYLLLPCIYKEDSSMILPVIMYVLIISAMLFLSIVRVHLLRSIPISSRIPCLIGAIYFVLSDSILGLDKFYVPVKFSEVSYSLLQKSKTRLELEGSSFAFYRAAETSFPMSSSRDDMVDLSFEMLRTNGIDGSQFHSEIQPDNDHEAFNDNTMKDFHQHHDEQIYSEMSKDVISTDQERQLNISKGRWEENNKIPRDEDKSSDSRSHIRTSHKEQKVTPSNMAKFTIEENEGIYDDLDRYLNFNLLEEGNSQDDVKDVKGLLRKYLTVEQKEFLVDLASELDNILEREVFSHNLAKVVIMITYYLAQLNLALSCIHLYPF